MKVIGLDKFAFGYPIWVVLLCTVGSYPYILPSICCFIFVLMVIISGASRDEFKFTVLSLKSTSSDSTPTGNKFFCFLFCHNNGEDDVQCRSIEESYEYGYMPYAVPTIIIVLLSVFLPISLICTFFSFVNHRKRYCTHVIFSLISIAFFSFSCISLLLFLILAASGETTGDFSRVFEPSGCSENMDPVTSDICDPQLVDYDCFCNSCPFRDESFGNNIFPKDPFKDLNRYIVLCSGENTERAQCLQSLKDNLPAQYSSVGYSIVHCNEIGLLNNSDNVYCSKFIANKRSPILDSDYISDNIERFRNAFFGMFMSALLIMVLFPITLWITCSVVGIVAIFVTRKYVDSKEKCVEVLKILSVVLCGEDREYIRIN